MLRMLNLTNQELEGIHHSGIDDSRNIAKIANWLYQKGYVFKVTSDGFLDEQDLERKDMLRREKEMAKQAIEEERIKKLCAGEMKPRDMFRDEKRYSKWDEDGIPTHGVDGKALSKSAVNKRKKMWKAQQVLHEKYLAWKQSLGPEG